MQFFCFFYKNMLGKPLGFGHTHENKIFFVFLRKINLKVLRFFFWILNFFKRNVSEKIEHFNTESVSYSVKIQLNIIQN